MKRRSTGRARVIVVSFALAAVLIYLAGRSLLRGRRRLGLFLRRFGYGEATRTISRVVAGRTGRSWRIVTLDDALIAPIGTRRRWMSTLVAVVAAGVAVVALFWLFGDGLRDYVNGLNLQDGTAEADDAFGVRVGGVLVAAYAGAVVLIGAAVAAVVAGIGAMTRRSARRAKRQASVVIDRHEQVTPVARLIAKRNRRILGSRLVVSRVDTAYWQPTATALANVADVIIPAERQRGVGAGDGTGRFRQTFCTRVPPRTGHATDVARHRPGSLAVRATRASSRRRGRTHVLQRPSRAAPIRPFVTDAWTPSPVVRPDGRWRRTPRISRLAASRRPDG